MFGKDGPLPPSRPIARQIFRTGRTSNGPMTIGSRMATEPPIALADLREQRPPATAALVGIAHLKAGMMEADPRRLGEGARRCIVFRECQRHFRQAAGGRLHQVLTIRVRCPNAVNQCGSGRIWPLAGGDEPESRCRASRTFRRFNPSPEVYAWAREWPTGSSCEPAIRRSASIVQSAVARSPVDRSFSRSGSAITGPASVLLTSTM